MSMKTLVIGLGGFGCSLAEEAAERFQQAAEENISFIGIDTDETGYRRNLRKIILMDDPCATVARMLEACPEAKEWFPNSDVVLHQSMNFGFTPNRYIPRLAFEYAVRTGTVKLIPLHQMIQSICSREEATSLQVILVSSLAGGTGTGLMIPVAQYIRGYLKDFTQLEASVKGFFILPKVFQACRWWIESAQKVQQGAFCYAALSELNELMSLSDDQVSPPEWVPFSENSSGSLNTRKPYDSIFLLDASSHTETNDEYVNDSLFAYLASHMNVSALESNLAAMTQTSERMPEKGIRFSTAQVLRLACLSSETQELYLSWCMGEILQNVWVSPEQSERFVNEPLLDLRGGGALDRVCAYYDSERRRLAEVPGEKIDLFLNRIKERAKQEVNAGKTGSTGRAEKWGAVLANLEERVSTVAALRTAERRAVGKDEALEMIRDFLRDESTGKMSHPVRALALLKAVSEKIRPLVMRNTMIPDMSKVTEEAGALLETCRNLTGVQRLMRGAQYTEKAYGMIRHLSILAGRMRIATYCEAVDELLPGLIDRYNQLFSVIPEIVNRCRLSARQRLDKLRGGNTFWINDMSLEELQDCYESWMMEGNDLLDCGDLYDMIWKAVQYDYGKRAVTKDARDRRKNGKSDFTPVIDAGIHGAHQHEVAGVGLRGGGAHHGDPSLLHGLAEDLQHVLVKLRQLVQKEDPVVGQGDLSRLGVGVPAPGHPRGGGGVMGGAEGPGGEEGPVLGGQPHDGVDLGGLQGLGPGHGGQDGGQPLGRHALARPRRAHQQDVMSPGGGDLQHPLHLLLAPDLIEVGEVGSLPAAGPGRGGGEGGPAGEVVGQLEHGLHRIDGEPPGQGGFGG